MPVSGSPLPTNIVDGDPGHTAAHNATNARVNDAVAEVNAHEAATTGVHGITDTAVLATSSSVASAVTAHVGAADPHGDRAYTDTALGPYLTTGAAPELIRDVMGATLVAGSNVTITPDDGSDTITIAAAAGGGTVEQSQVTGLVSDLAGKQPLDADLTAISAAAPSDDDLLQRKAGAWTSRTLAQVKADLAISQPDVSGLPAALSGKASTTVTDALDGRLDKLDSPTVTLADGGTVAVDATDGRTHKVTVAGDRVIGKPSGGYDGQFLTLTIEQDGAGGRAWVLGAGYRVPNGLEVIPTTVAGAKDRVAVAYDEDDDVWDVLAFLPASGVTAGEARKPWQFHVADYGAKGDGRMLVDVAMTAASTTLTSASANFTPADVGKHILVNEAGPAKTQYTSGALITTISAVTNSTTATLAAAASRTVSGQEAMYGTDDTAALQAAMEALTASANWTGGTYYCELLLDPKIYILASAPTPGGNPENPTHGNAQIPLPYQADVTKTKPTIVIQGAREGDYKGLWLQEHPQPTGCVLFSMLDGAQTEQDSTYGPVSVIGGPTIRSTWADPNASNNVQVSIDGIQVMTPVNPGLIAFDFYWMTAFRAGRISAMPFAGVAGQPSYSTATTNDRGLGFRTNTTGLNDRCDIEHISIEGFYAGMTLDEHMAVHSCKIIYAHYGLLLTGEVASGSNRSSHGCWVGYASVEIVDYCVYTQTGGGGSLFSLNIDLIDNEGGVTEHIHDPNNALTGSINIMPSASAALPIATIVNGGKHLNIRDVGKPRGAIASPLVTPTVPATTTPLKNPMYRDALVCVAGGTVTDIAIDGVSTGATSGTILLPSGMEITLTYSSAPTWSWVLL